MQLFALLQLGQWASWLAGHWAGIVGFVLGAAFVYLCTAVMLDLPLPFESKDKGD